MALHFGKHEQIFDPFNLITIDNISYPDDIKHFIGQLPSSKYIHCPPSRTEWISRNNQTIDQNKVEASKSAFINFKSFMRQMEMVFWMACGTLLGMIANGYYSQLPLIWKK